jgi:murein L,D-transpeptidase YcbB/YkuD
VQSGKRRIVKLKRKIPVYVTYITAFANKDGSIHFRRDVYGRDGELAEQLLTGGRYAEADNH